MTATDERIDALLRTRLTAAAQELRADDGARRRITDTTAPRRTLRPLAAALAFAVVAAAGGGVLAKQLHHTTPAGSAHHNRTAPPAPTPTASPSPMPIAHQWPPLFPPDDLTLGRQAAYGHLSLTGNDNTLAVGRYHLSVTNDPGNPATSPVWRYDHSPPADEQTLGARFGITAPPSPSAYGWQWPGLSDDPASGMLSYWTTTSPDPSSLRLDAVPTDAASVAQLSTRFLSRAGLLLDGLSQPDVRNYGQANAPQPVPWGVSWSRSIGGRPLLMGGMSMSVDAQGYVRNLTVTSHHVAGGAPYPLIPWRQAWTQVSAGHWYVERGGFTGGNGQSSVQLFDCTSVQLGYLIPDAPPPGAAGDPTEQRYLVPMWAFTDADGGITLFYPAVASTDLTYTWAPKPWPSTH